MGRSRPERIYTSRVLPTPPVQKHASSSPFRRPPSGRITFCRLLFLEVCLQMSFCLRLTLVISSSVMSLSHCLFLRLLYLLLYLSLSLLLCRLPVDLNKSVFASLSHISRFSLRLGRCDYWLPTPLSLASLQSLTYLVKGWTAYCTRKIGSLVDDNVNSARAH